MRAGLIKRYLTVMMAAGLCVPVAGGCKPETPDNPAPVDPVVPDGSETEGEKLADISTFQIGDTFQIPLSGNLHLPYSGVRTGDPIVLTLRSDNSVAYKLSCTSASDTKGADFSVPKRFIGAMCEVTAFGKTYNTFVEVVDTTAVEKVAGRTTYGKVIDYDGKPVEGVSVSDGVMVTVTDRNGCYYLASMRKNGYVFISVPKNYRVAVNRSIPQFFYRFKSDRSSVYEQHNFILEPENNVSHRLVAFTDNHLANRTKDIHQFETYFKKELREQVSNAGSESVPLYAVCLGDLTWDDWWYKNSYSPENYYKTMSDMDIPVYNIPGNHDNDPYIPDDFKAEEPFRKWIGPTYYSFNIGDVHYVMMDNTIFNNSGATEGSSNVQDYTEGFTDNQMKWLEADLSHVKAGSTVFFGTHIQYTGRPSANADGTFSYSYNMPPEFRSELVRLFEPFNVHIITGHTHVNYTNQISSRVIEHNIAAVCATWWWTGYYTDDRCQMCRDGSPAGYKVFDISPDGTVKWIYKPVNRESSYQVRVYDLNNCYITRKEFCPKSTTSKVSDAVFSQYCYGYDTKRSDNKLLVNVFDWDESWTVRAEQGGKSLDVKRVDSYDPLHVVHFNMNRMNTNSTAVTFPTLKTSHLFEVSASDASSVVTVIVTDRFGREYRETVSRPRTLYEMSKSSSY